MSRIAGAILAGGQARRLGGVAKGALDAGRGATIVERLLGELTRAGVAEIVISANDPGPYQRYGRQIVADIHQGVGPLGGVEAVLTRLAGRADAVCLLACDLPQTTSREILALTEAFSAGTAPVVLAETGISLWHPLCSVVDSGIVASVSAAIDRGDRGVKELWRELGAAVVHFDDESGFLNVNTPADLARWRSGEDGPR